MIRIENYEEKYVTEISNLIIRNLKEINVKDYGTERINQMAEDFRVEKLKDILKRRKKVYVALINDEVVGTAGMDKSWYNDNDDEYWILSVFVKPEYHGYGIGRMLIERIEDFARGLHVRKLVVPASITARGFYGKMGFGYKDGKEVVNEENMYIMEKEL